MLLAACSTAPTKPAPGGHHPRRPSTTRTTAPATTSPANLDAIPGRGPAPEPLHRSANRPYTVFGREYVPATSLRPYRERGIASWYGRKFHGQKTSIGEIYDMYAMTAAHPTLPLPSYARVTNVATGRSVVVRVNDRGPFLHDRVIDLSYAAAHRIGIAQKGSGEVEVEAILPGDSPGSRRRRCRRWWRRRPSRHAPPPPRRPQSVRRRAGDAGGASRCSSAPSPTSPTRRTFSSTCRTNWPARRSKRRSGRSTALSVYVGPYPDRDEARRVAERMESAFGFATTVAPH